MHFGVLGPREVVLAVKNNDVPQGAHGHAVLAAQLPADWDAQLVYDNHELLMLHGQKVCLYRNPACHRCPLTDLCDYFQERGVPLN